MTTELAPLELRSADPFISFRFPGEGPQGRDVKVWGRTRRHAANVLADWERRGDPQPWSQDDFQDRVEGLLEASLI